MRTKNRLLILAVLISVFGVTLSSIAQSRQIEEVPDYRSLRTFFHPDIPEDYVIEEGEPFWWGGGVGDVMPGFSPEDYQILLFMDGAQVEPTFVGCTDPETAPDQRCRNFIYDFPEGLPAGEYQFYVAYVAPCGVWLGGFGEEWTVTSCVDDRFVMAHPELEGFKTLTVIRSELLENPDNGHSYEAIVSTEGLDWADARADAESRSVGGVQGHLATITSAGEDLWFQEAFAQVLSAGPWLGGFQPDGSGEPADNWQWVTGEPFDYTNWGDGEPNDADGEDCLQYLPDPPSWNDFPCGAGPGAVYIVEYDTNGA